MIVPALPPDIGVLKERVAAFLQAEVYPLEDRIAAESKMNESWAEELRRNTRGEGFRRR